MTLVKWRPFEDRLSQLFGENMKFDLEATKNHWLPAADIYELEDSVNIEVELPGLDKDSIDVSIENNVLTISGERKKESEEKTENYHRVERVYGTFQRSFSLPNTVETDNITAKFQDGVLIVAIPKSELAKPKKINVLSSE